MREKLTRLISIIRSKKWLKVAIIVFVPLTILTLTMGLVHTQTRLHSQAATDKSVLAKDSHDLRDSNEPRESHEVHRVEATSYGSFTPKAIKLPQTGWTATASDQAAAYPVNYVVDGNTNTFWHSGIEPATVPLPHTVTIDIKAIKDISGLTYLPRQDGSSDGRIGRYTISVSSYGTTWSAPVATGTWADTADLKVSVFPSVKARYIRLTALTEAGDRGGWSAAAEINLFSDPAADPALPRSGWVATASDSYTGYPPSNVLDGNATTIWHSKAGSQPAPFPHNLIIDMRGLKRVTGFTYLPRQDASNNGNIGRFHIYVSTDGVNWGSSIANGTFADDKSLKTFILPAPRTIRYFRIKTFSEAGSRGPWSSAAEVHILGFELKGTTIGRWDAPIGLPLVPVSAALLPNNKLVLFSAYDAMNFGLDHPMTVTTVMDLETGIVEQAKVVNTNHEMFCTGLSVLSDGRLFITGGSGPVSTTFYDYATNTWSAGPTMIIPRGYNSSTTLSTGQVFTIGGSWSGGVGGKHGEIFTPDGTAGTWTRLPNVPVNNIVTADPSADKADNHAWLFGVANSMVFHAGPSKQMNWISASGSGSITSAGNRSDNPDAMNGTAVMYDIGKIFTSGGATAYWDPGSMQAHKTAYIIDISRGPTQPVITTKVFDMVYERAFHNSVVLPDGRVLIVGGQQHPQGFTDTGAAKSPELWDPVTRRTTVMAADIIPRTYHSIAILLPDGRVLSAGGGLCGTCTVNHPDARIFTPPYLLNNDGSLRTRPTITNAPSAAAPGTSIDITTNTPVTKFALIRTSAVTHSVNTDQRRIPLTPTATNGTTYTLAIPSDRGIVLPGMYLLFALDSSSTPSKATFIHIN